MRRRLLVSLVTLFLMLLLLEGAVRVRQYVKYGTTGQRHHRLERHEASGLMVPEANSVSGSIVVNGEGFRSPSIPVDKPAGTIRLAFLGGSTTFCAEVSSNAMTWPHLVLERLREAYPAASFDYLNAGAAGYTTRESLANLRHRVRPYDPDVLVVYHGTNDLVHESRRLAIERGLIEPDSDETGGWLAEHSMLWFLLRKNVLFRQRQTVAAAGEAGMPFDPDAIGGPFAARLEELLDAGLLGPEDATADLAVLPTFAVRLRAEQGPEERIAAAASALYYMPYFNPDQVLAGYEAINATIRTVAAGRPDVLLVEGEDSIPADDAHFADTVHFLDPGAEAQAARVADALLASPAFAALVGAR